MGVFARLLRRSKATEEASTAEAQDGAVTAPAESVAEEAAEAKGSAKTSEDQSEDAGAAEVEPTAAQAETPAETVESGSGEGVDIPKQQSAEATADSEAGEGART
ncbi:hypothetical protein [Streptomyces pseudovenezuelae]|uniref:Gliding motility protein n=1 Tax=Streptomyces pseudovenezuelae TaxID=67350 RepID=A0ABT6M2C9_9ACTN|nr:hypothetical protein [Streptomyces pseudovenezuelae]MDH6222161.1 hypothetical protein [Streptomyces pseudovenezuelae]